MPKKERATASITHSRWKGLSCLMPDSQHDNNQRKTLQQAWESIKYETSCSFPGSHWRAGLLFFQMFVANVSCVINRLSSWLLDWRVTARRSQHKVRWIKMNCALAASTKQTWSELHQRHQPWIGITWVFVGASLWEMASSIVRWCGCKACLAHLTNLSYPHKKTSLFSCIVFVWLFPRLSAFCLSSVSASGPLQTFKRPLWFHT